MWVSWPVLSPLDCHCILLHPGHRQKSVGLAPCIFMSVKIQMSQPQLNLLSLPT